MNNEATEHTEKIIYIEKVENLYITLNEWYEQPVDEEADEYDA